VDVIIKAAEMTQGLKAQWVLLGEGDLRSENELNARGLANVRFEPWIDYRQLPNRLSKAHIVLGIFGTSRKADLVIPNKLFQAMAVARPVITRRSKAYENTIADSDIIGWVPAGDPKSLAEMVKKWCKTPSDLSVRGRETRKLYEAYFSSSMLTQMLRVVLDTALTSKSEGKKKRL
jgi:glycosyltransferase involved in cell wall biosynthesis